MVDYTTHQPLSDARLFAKLATGRTLVSVTAALGRFVGEIPCEAVAIQIERAGYRPQILPLQSIMQSQDEQRVAFIIPLIAIEQQSRDRTYLQTAQTDYVHQSSTKTFSKAGNNAVQHAQFVVTDAVRNTPLQARLCLIYTKDGTKRCVDTDLSGRFNFDFNQADIVAIEATATGYQRYEGNLIVESLDGRSSIHRIQLQRTLTILAVKVENAARCALLAGNRTYALENVPGQANWFSTYELMPNLYNLIVLREQGTTRQPVRLSSGLNHITLEAQEPSAILNPAARTKPIASITIGAPTPLISPDSLPMIYFEQSSYKLRPDSEEVLRQVALYLKHHKDYVLQVAGHTDNVGDKHLNKSLSDFRAAVVTTFLTRQGIPERQCVKAGLGSQYPIAPNDTEANKALNRRVSLKLIAAQ